LAKDNGHTQEAGQNLRSTRMLKAAFIEAKKEQILGNKTKAKSIFESVLEKDATCAACAYELARMAIGNDNANEAIKMSKIALSGDPNNPFYKEQQAEIIYRIGNSSEAAKISESIMDSFPKIRIHYKRTVFYYEKARLFTDAERILNRFEQQFGFSYQTAMMFDYLYDLQDNGPGKIENWAKLVKKYPNDIGYRKKYVNGLIDEAKYGQAKAELDILAPKLNQPGYTYLIKSRINSIQKDWPNYIIQLRKIAMDTMLAPNLKTRYLVESVEIRDTAILEPMRIIAAQDPAAQTYVNFYLKQFGAQVDESKNLEAKYKTNPSDEKLAIAWSNMLYNQGKYVAAAIVSLNLVETHPSIVSYYHLHAKNLMAQGSFADAYSYANQGLTYAITKDERCKSHVLQAQSNFYLGKQINVNEELKMAWANKGFDHAVNEQLCYISMVSGFFIEETKQELKTLQSEYMNQLYALISADDYSSNAWNILEGLNKGNSRIVEAHMFKARKAGASEEFETLKSRMAV